jgi:hypothetical protein
MLFNLFCGIPHGSIARRMDSNGCSIQHATFLGASAPRKLAHPTIFSFISNTAFATNVLYGKIRG